MDDSYPDSSYDNYDVYLCCAQEVLESESGGIFSAKAEVFLFISSFPA